MLKITKITWSSPPTIDDTGESLFKRNPRLHLEISAPIFWWKDSDFIYNVQSLVDTKSMTDFCFDEWAISEPIVQALTLAITQEQAKHPKPNTQEFRRLIEILPMGIMVFGTLTLNYQAIVTYVEDYLDESLFSTDFLPTRREWTDFCETLLDIRGVRDYVREEELRGDE